MPDAPIPDAAILIAGVDRLPAAVVRRLLSSDGALQPESITLEALQEAGASARVAEAALQFLRDPDAQSGIRDEIHAAMGEGSRLLDPETTLRLPGITALPDPPLLLVAGARFELEHLERRRVAIVGSRHPTDYGRTIAGRLGRELAAAGCLVISGGATGIDSTAHAGAIASGGPTLAVLGGALAVERERRVTAFDAIAESVAVVTEQLLPLPIQPWMFPKRNRLVAAMAEAVVVVEGAAGSGALITAEWAERLNRTILAVPGRVTDPKAEAPNRLLAQGATLCRGAPDVLSCLGEAGAADQPGETSGAAERRTPSPPTGSLDRDQRAVFDLLCEAGAALHIDEIATRLGRSPTALSQAVLGLELKGLCRQRAGQLIEIVQREEAPRDKPPVAS